MMRTASYMSVFHEDEEFIARQRHKENERLSLKLLCLIHITIFTTFLTHESLIALFMEGHK
jgi:hypothetical protein